MLRIVRASELPPATRLDQILGQVSALESQSYPASEAASEARLKQRLLECAQIFSLLLRVEDGKEPVVLGYACGTQGYHLDDAEAMGRHDKHGVFALLHSVVVAPALQHQGWAIKLVEDFVAAAAPRTVRLISKSHLIPLYQRAGFSLLGPSNICHGAEAWFEMECLALGAKHAVCVDAFAEQVFSGNAAGVVLNDATASASSKRTKTTSEVGYFQKVAREINAPETAFVQVLNAVEYNTAQTELSLEAVRETANGAYQHLCFNDALACISKHFVFEPKAMLKVGSFQSSLGQNVGSLKTLAFARAVLPWETTPLHDVAALWREHYDMVLAHPDTELDKHVNIRNFLAGGAVTFTHSETGAELVSPIIDVDIHGLALLLKHCTMDSVFDALNKNELDALVELHAPGSNLAELRAWGQGADVVLQKASALLFSLMGGNAGFSTRQVINASALDCSIRWFTPTGVEVDLCGHATLAAAHALFYEFGPIANNCAFDEIRFRAQNGLELRAKKRAGAAAGKQIELDFPLQCTSEFDFKLDWSKAFPQMHKDDLVWSGLSGNGGTGKNVVLQVKSKQAFVERFASPDFAWMKENLAQYRGVSVTVRDEDAGGDFLSRFFAPMIGINEDPVTGSAHCYLAEHWSTRLGKPSGAELVGLQYSIRGIGRVLCRIEGDRIKLAGTAKVAWKGQIAGE